MQQKSDNVVSHYVFEAPVRDMALADGVMHGVVDGHRLLYRQAATFRQRRVRTYLILIWATSG